MTKNQTVQIAEAKGRPMLHWVGKRPLDHVTAFPAQLVERFDPAGELQTSEVSETSEVSGNLLFHGDNKDVLAWLLAHGYRGKVNLIYIDPPFDSGADYVRRVQLRGIRRTERLEGEAYTLGEQIQYTDIWANDTYLQFMYERLLLLEELMAEDGNIFLHCDDVKNYLLRSILEELFPGCFRNEIIWKRTTSTGLAQKRCGTLHDTIYWYSKSHEYKFNMQYHAYDEKYLQRAREDENGRLYIPIPTGNPGPRPNLYYEYKGYWPHPHGYKWTREKMEEFDRQGRLIFPEDKGGRIQYKQYLDEMEGVKLQDLWTDIPAVNPVAHERTDYPTQKPEALLERIVKMASDPGDLILDCFVGCGTTAAVAQKLGRRWIAADINKGAIQITSKRLQTIIREQVEVGAVQTSEVSETSEVSPPPAALSFSVYRINDYDLQVQHNEAVNLAVQLVGIERTKTDPFFDGTLGRRLVKIVPFNHPLTLLDLQLLQDELKARPDEERDVVVVCLGKETAIDPWLEEYNKRRPVNKMEVIELRTDQKYGKFFVHQPAQAQVQIERVQTSEVWQTSEVLVVEIEDFISPTIVERLEMDTPLFKVQIPDWRAMVDVVLIDTTYDGEVFDINLSDVPEKKDDLVSGHYELPAPDGPSTVAVKIIDMLGEEVLVTAEV
jgi:DNA modification methylase